MKNFLKVGIVFALSTVFSKAFSDSNVVVKNLQLKSAQGLEIFVNAEIQETEPDAWGNQTRILKQFKVQTSDFGSFRAVVVLNCSAYRYPNSWNYEQTFQIDGEQSSGGAPFVAQSFSKYQIAYAGFGGDSDSCRVNLALVKNDIWQIDPVNDTTHFLLNL